MQDFKWPLAINSLYHGLILADEWYDWPIDLTDWPVDLHFSHTLSSAHTRTNPVNSFKSYILRLHMQPSPSNLVL